VGEHSEYLTIEDAAEFLGKSRRTLERYVEQGRITRYRRGLLRNVYFKRTDVESLKASFSEYHPDNEREES